jgi:hypothetical protein
MTDTLDIALKALELAMLSATARTSPSAVRSQVGFGQGEAEKAA